jgi:hypothetical protein
MAELSVMFPRQAPNATTLLLGSGTSVREATAKAWAFKAPEVMPSLSRHLSFPVLGEERFLDCARLRCGFGGLRSK